MQSLVVVLAAVRGRVELALQLLVVAQFLARVAVVVAVL